MPAKILGDNPRAVVRRKVKAKAADAATKAALETPFGQLEILGEVSDETAAVLSQAIRRKHERDPELIDLAIQHDGGPAALSDHFHPMPAGFEKPEEWADIQARLLVHVPLVKAAVRRLRSAVYGGSVRRTIASNPYEAKIEEFIGRRYPALMRAWFENKVLFGTGVAVPIINGRGKLELWQPYPPNTHLFVNDNHVRDYIGLVEFSADGETMKFVTRDAAGLVRKGEKVYVIGPREKAPPEARSVIQTCNFGFFPGVVGYGQDRRHRGEAEGVSLVREAVKGAVRATDCLLNASLLQKKQTRALLWAKDTTPGDAQDAVEGGRGLGGVVVGGKDFQIGYATPATGMIAETLKVFEVIIFDMSLALGVPVDDLYQNTGVDQSAEASRRRAIQFTGITQELAEASQLDEEDLILKATAMLRWDETKRPVDLDALQDSVATHIVMNPTVFPESNNEKVTNAIALNAAGIKTDEDTAWAFNAEKDRNAIPPIAAEIKRRRDLKEAQGLPGVAGAQGPLKTAASAQNT